MNDKNTVEDKLNVILEKLHDLDVKQDAMQKELKTKQVELQNELRVIQKDLSDQIDELDTNLKTVEYYQRTVGLAYTPPSPELTPTGQALIEPRQRWVRDHPYRK